MEGNKEKSLQPQNGCDINIQGIDGTFHAFSCFGRHLVFHLQSMNVFTIPQNVYQEWMNTNTTSQETIAKMQKACTTANMQAAKDTPHYDNARVIPTLTLFLTHACNLNCPYCFDRAANGNQIAMTFETAIKQINASITENKSLEVVFFGGEPLLEFELLKKIVAYCDALRQNGTLDFLSYKLTTNGVLLDKNIAQYLAARNFGVMISADGCYSTELKQHVGSSYKALPRNQENVYQLLGDFAIRATVSSPYINHIQDLYNAFLKANPSEINICPAIDPDFPFEAKDKFRWRKQTEAIVYAHYKSGKPKQGCAINDIDNVVNALTQKRRLPTACYAGKANKAVDVTGACYPCQRYVAQGTNYTVANIHRNKAHLIVDCNSCWAQPLCGGLCMYHAMLTDADTQKFLCHSRMVNAQLACWVYAVKV